MHRREGASVDGAWGSGCALVAATLAAHAPGPTVVVSPFADDLDALADEVALFAGDRVERFPAWETPDEIESAVATDPIFADRLRVVKSLAHERPLIVAAIDHFGQQLVGRDIEELMAGFGRVFKAIADDPQYRWVGPHKGVVHLALGAITNA